MNWFTGGVVYLLIWWVVLFAVLPIGVQPDADGTETPGGWRGAPRRPRLWMKLLLCTVISAVLWLGAYWLITSDWISFRSGWLAMPEK